MKKIIYLFSVSLICLYTLSSCSSDSPGQVAKKFVGYMQSGDSKNMIECLATNKNIDPSQQKQGELAMAAMAEKAKTALAEKGGIKNVEVTSETIEENGENAKVELKISYGNGVEEKNSYQMVKQDGKWKIRQ